ncbi:hypothetical protein OG946_01400 [Streptomyces sp. NBC_01808]|uniref:hypothetical protein n=1 Tax=Streptomyces sp. NBC_01808 TaxID=2975947 RepID=UPI002DDAA5A6|nr:hypothetical protein [Streptomyces sp. NBC_01808]WSA36141.1 hypothetical protein OG946_01400 [Streptomyces sp. NBC_01808]
MKRLTKYLDLPLVQRFLGNRLAIGAVCALMVVTGVVAAMLTTGGTEPVSDAKSAVRESAAEAAEPEDQSGEEAGEQAAEEEAGAQSGQEQAAEPAGGGQDSAKPGEQPPAPSRGEHHPPRRSGGDGHRLATSFDNGTFFVGGAIAPGTYATQGSDGEPGGCRWARLADNRGELIPIISGSAWGPTHITVHDGEYVRSTGCQTWSRTGSGGPNHGK